MPRPFVYQNAKIYAGIISICGKTFWFNQFGILVLILNSIPETYNRHRIVLPYKIKSLDSESEAPR